MIAGLYAYNLHDNVKINNICRGFFSESNSIVWSLYLCPSMALISKSLLLEKFILQLLVTYGPDRRSIKKVAMKRIVK